MGRETLQTPTPTSAFHSYPEGQELTILRTGMYPLSRRQCCAIILSSVRSLPTRVRNGSCAIPSCRSLSPIQYFRRTCPRQEEFAPTRVKLSIEGWVLGAWRWWACGAGATLLLFLFSSSLVRVRVGFG